MLHVEEVKISVSTDRREYRAEATFGAGLNVVLAHNSSGKSTLLQAIIYALGLERTLGPNLELPLPYAVHQRLHATPGGDYENVAASHVEVQIRNAAGKIVVARRDIVGGADRKLIRASMVSEGDVQRDFFVHDPGSAQHEDGFHQFLADFAGWQLPLVPTYDGREIPLYIETLFPMFFVEQKRGWSAIQGPFPTFMRIQDVNRRVLEFLLDLDAGRARRRIAELRALLSQLRAQWEAARAELGKSLPAGIRLGQLPSEPTVETTETSSFPVEAFRNSAWTSASGFLEAVTKEIAELEQEVEPESTDNSEAIQRELASEREKLDAANVSLESVRQEFSLVQADRNALSQRIAILQSDLTRNQDSAKLERLGSKLGRAATEHVCPTCHQELSSELLPTVAFAAMAVDENISFIRSQLSLCEAARNTAANQLNNLQSIYAAVNSDIAQKQLRIRQLRAALIRPDQSVSRAAVEKIVALQARVDAVGRAQENVDQASDNLRAIAKQFVTASNELKSIRTQDVTTRDQQKLDALAGRLRSELVEFGFKSFETQEIQLSDDNFRPIVVQQEDGEVIERELGFEMSASDGIRMKWAYYLALLETTNSLGGNHSGLVIFDEPGQQAMESESLRAFLVHCAKSGARDRQLVVAATTEKVDEYASELIAAGAHVHRFEGLVLQPVG